MERRWRVRTWIRLAAVAAWLGLLAQQFSTIHFVRLGEMNPSEVPLGWAFLVVLALAIWSIAFRPYIAVSADTVTLRGPLRRFDLARADVVEVEPTAWGLRFTPREGARHTSIVCQATRSFGEPRWFDVAEAVLGSRPGTETRTDAETADGATSEVLQQLEDYTRSLVGDSASISRFRFDDGRVEGRIEGFEVTPTQPGARGITVIAEQWILVEIGRQGGRWELDYTEDDTALARELIAAVVAGRVVETHGLGRSEVTATLADGSSRRETGYNGCLTVLIPQPGWRRWGRREANAAYHL